MHKVKSLNSRHRIMMHRLMLGERATDIAKDMCMSDTTFSIIKNSPLFQAELGRLTHVARHTLVATSNEVADIINVAAPQAARKLVDLVDAEDDRVAMNAAEKIIDYSDFGRSHSEAINRPIVINQQQLVHIEEALGDAATPLSGRGNNGS